MPERGEVYTFEVQLNAALKGKTLIGMEITSGSRYSKKGTIPGMEYILNQKCLIVGVKSRGKKLIFEFLRSDGVMVYLISFLGMSGRWQLANDEHCGFNIQAGSIVKKKSCTLSIITDIIHYRDHRHMGTLQFIVTPAEMKHVFKSVGPDLLYDNVTLEQYNSILRNKRIQHWPICKFIMDQSRLAGCGNWMKAEILYSSCISPYRILSSLTDEEVQRIFAWTMYILGESVRNRGLTIGDFFDLSGNKGLYKPKVYKLTSSPEGYPVIKESCGDGRTTHWCPNIQK